MADINDKLALSKALFGSRVTGAGNLRRTTGTALSASSQGRVNVLFSDDDAGEGIEVDCLGTVKEGDTVTILVEGGKPTCLGPAGWGDAIEDQIGQIEAGAGTYVGTCSTDGATAAKTASIEGFELREGATVLLTFEHANTAPGVTLDVSGTGAKPVVNLGAQVGDGIWRDGESVLLAYDGESWQVIGDSVYAQQVTVGLPSEGNVHIDSDSVDIRDGATVLASLSENAIEIGRAADVNQDVVVTISDSFSISTQRTQYPNSAQTFLHSSVEVDEQLDIKAIAYDENMFAVARLEAASNSPGVSTGYIQFGANNQGHSYANLYATDGIELYSDSLEWNGNAVAYAESSCTRFSCFQSVSYSQRWGVRMYGEEGRVALVDNGRQLLCYDYDQGKSVASNPWGAGNVIKCWGTQETPLNSTGGTWYNGTLSGAQYLENDPMACFASGGNGRVNITRSGVYLVWGGIRVIGSGHTVGFAARLNDGTVLSQMVDYVDSQPYFLHTPPQVWQLEAGDYIIPAFRSDGSVTVGASSSERYTFISVLCLAAW